MIDTAGEICLVMVLLIAVIFLTALIIRFHDIVSNDNIYKANALYNEILEKKEIESTKKQSQPVERMYVGRGVCMYEDDDGNVYL